MVHGRILDSLKNNALRKNLIHHPFFEAVRSGTPARNDVAVFLGQWWHPLHYFPNFLSRSISVVPNLETKTAICSILSEELGEGNPERAHERIYIETMTAAGFSRQEILKLLLLALPASLYKGTNAPPLRTPARLASCMELRWLIWQWFPESAWQ